MVATFFAATRTWAGPMSALHLELADMSKFKLRIVQFCLVPWIAGYVSSCSAPELAPSLMGASSMPVLSMWVHACWVSISYAQDWWCLGHAWLMSGLCHGLLQGSSGITVTLASADHAVHGVLTPYPMSELCSIQSFIYRLIQDKNGCHCS